MATLEQIIDEARSLSPAEKRKPRQILDLELEQAKSHDRAQTTHSDNGGDEMRERRLVWLKAHREEYADQYVALAGDVLVGHGRQFAKPMNKPDRKALRIPLWYA